MRGLALLATYLRSTAVVVAPNVVILVGLACPSNIWKIPGREMLRVKQAFL